MNSILTGKPNFGLSNGENHMEQMKVGILSTYPPRICGIADYTVHLENEMKRHADVFVVPIEDPFSTDANYYRQMALDLSRGDVAHIQHEYAIFGRRYSGRPYIPMFAEIMGASNYAPLIYKTLAQTKTKVVTTLHEASRDRQLHNLNYRVFRTKDDDRPLNFIGRAMSAVNKAIICKGVDRQIEAVVCGSHRIIVQTQNARNTLLKRGVADEKICVIPHGIYQNPEFPDKKQSRQQFGVAGKRVLTIFGFVRRYKGYEEVIPVLKELPDDIVLLIAGGARIPEHQSYVDSLQAKVDEMGLGDRVVISGYVKPDQISAAMAATDIALYAYHGTEQSGSLTIAIAHKVPTIASDVTGFREIAEERKCIEIFTSPEDLRTRIMEILEDPERQENLRRNCQAYWESANWAQVARKTFELYKEVLSS